MTLNISMLFILINYIVLHLLFTEISSGTAELQFCGVYKGDGAGRINVTCFEQLTNYSNSVCGNKPDFKEINVTDLSNALTIELQDCPLKLGIFLSANLARLQSFHSSHNHIPVLQNNIFSGMCFLLEILLYNSSIEIIQPSAFSCLSLVFKLEMFNNKIEFLPDHLFKDMTNLGYLVIDYSNIHTLPEGIFNNLRNLYYLRLQGNHIKSLPDKLFDRQIYLLTFNLNHNRVDKMSERVLSNLTELIELRLSGNDLKELRNVFTKNSKLELLSLNYNIGLVLNEDSFRGLFNLKKLQMFNCGITSLPNGLFKDTNKLSKINISRNRLKVIISDSFHSLRYLRHLDVSSNEISELQDQAFKHNTNIRTLLMFNNKLSEIKRDSFQGLTSTTILDISLNLVSKIDGDAFNNMAFLEELSMKGNLLVSLIGSHPFGMSSKLKLVDVSNNRLTDISNINWQQLPSLAYFFAINNTICDLFLTNFTRKQDLHVHMELNKVKYIHPNTGNKKHESSVGTDNYFYLVGNPLECDCHAYDLYMYLHSTVIKSKFPGGLFCRYPEKYQNTPLINLQPRDFVCNITDLCPENCICPYAVSDNVQTVNCRNRGHTYLPIQVPYNTTILDISHNNLTSLTGLNDNIWVNLTGIHADFNQIESDNVYLPKNIKYINLHHNKLEKIPEAVEKQCDMENNFKITISNNLWPCDCSMLFYKKYIDHIADITNVHCIFGNKSWSNASVIGLNEEDICPVSQIVQYASSSTVLLLLALVLVSYYRHKLYFLSFLYSHCNSCYMMFHQRKMESEAKRYDCFISYSSADRGVTLAILEELESKPPNYIFCIHERNWLPGKNIISNIEESVQNSRKTLIIVSKTFLQSSWFYMEFQAAYHKALEDRTDRLIIILKGELPEEKELDRDVLHVISTKTYLQWGEWWFWEKLRYAIYSENDFTERNSTSCFRRMTFWFIKKKTLKPKELELIASD